MRDLSRRIFLSASALPTLDKLIPSIFKPIEPLKPQLPSSSVYVYQSWAENDRTLIVALSQKNLKANLAPDSLATLNVVGRKKLNSSNWQVTYFLVENLQIDTDYAIDFTDDYFSKMGSRIFRSLDLQLATPRIAVASCSHFTRDSAADQIWKNFENQKPDVFFYIGDLIYANTLWDTGLGRSAPPEQALEKYILSWQNIPFYSLNRLVPTFAIWDDHDFGWNNGDSRHPNRNRMMEMFRDFYPMVESKTIATGPGVSFSMSAFGTDFYFLDDRSFYTRGQDHWGPMQWDWFETGYRSSLGPAWIINGCNILNYLRVSESIERDTPFSLTQLSALLKSHSRSQAFISGDVHYSQVHEIKSELFGQKTYEIVSSCIHSSASGSAGLRSRAQGQMMYFGDDNFLVLRLEASELSQKIEVQCISEKGLESNLTTGPLTI